jgi:hypothetical protein
MLDGQPQDQFPVVNASIGEIMARVGRISAPVPPDVELGFHICYGDFGAKHIIEPIDATKMVTAANAIAKAVPRRIDYIHMPIPIAWTEDRYYRPLAGLTLAPGTGIYLGLLHLADGEQGTQNRIELARHYVPDFGVAAECGIARARAPGLVRSILERHAAVTEEPAT